MIKNKIFPLIVFFTLYSISHSNSQFLGNSSFTKNIIIEKKTNGQKKEKGNNSYNSYLVNDKEDKIQFNSTSSIKKEDSYCSAKKGDVIEAWFYSKVNYNGEKAFVISSVKLISSKDNRKLNIESPHHNIVLTKSMMSEDAYKTLINTKPWRDIILNVGDISETTERGFFKYSYDNNSGMYLLPITYSNKHRLGFNNCLYFSSAKKKKSRNICEYKPNEKVKVEVISKGIRDTYPFLFSDINNKVIKEKFLLLKVLEGDFNGGDDFILGEYGVNIDSDKFKVGDRLILTLPKRMAVDTSCLTGSKLTKEIESHDYSQIFFNNGKWEDAVNKYGKDWKGWEVYIYKKDNVSDDFKKHFNNISIITRHKGNQNIIWTYDGKKWNKLNIVIQINDNNFKDKEDPIKRLQNSNMWKDGLKTYGEKWKKWEVLIPRDSVDKFDNILNGVSIVTRSKTKKDKIWILKGSKWNKLN